LARVGLYACCSMCVRVLACVYECGCAIVHVHRGRVSSTMAASAHVCVYRKFACVPSHETRNDCTVRTAPCSLLGGGITLVPAGSTETDTQQAASGEGFRSTDDGNLSLARGGGGIARSRNARRRMSGGGGGGDLKPSLDFLAQAGTVLANLKVWCRRCCEGRVKADECLCRGVSRGATCPLLTVSFPMKPALYVRVARGRESSFVVFAVGAPVRWRLTAAWWCPCPSCTRPAARWP
jgi:hypothetical protein